MVVVGALRLMAGLELIEGDSLVWVVFIDSMVFVSFFDSMAPYLAQSAARLRPVWLSPPRGQRPVHVLPWSWADQLVNRRPRSRAMGRWHYCHGPCVARFRSLGVISAR